MTETGKLPVGVEFNGETHRDYELRSQKFRDTRDAVIAVGTRDEMSVVAELFARRLLKLGTIPKEKITRDMVLDFEAIDIEELERADARLKKKMLAGSAGASEISDGNNTPA